MSDSLIRDDWANLVAAARSFGSTVYWELRERMIDRIDDFRQSLTSLGSRYFKPMDLSGNWTKPPQYTLYDFQIVAKSGVKQTVTAVNRLFSNPYER